MTAPDIKTGPAPVLSRLDSVSLAIDAHTGNLAAVADFIREFALHAGFNERDSGQIELAVDELVTNSIIHGYSGSKEGQIFIEASTIPRGIMIVVEERGRPFDPASVKAPVLDAPLAEREIGGLGIYFAKQIMDEIYYETLGDNLKRFTLIKRKKGQ